MAGLGGGLQAWYGERDRQGFNRASRGMLPKGQADLGQGLGRQAGRGKQDSQKGMAYSNVGSISNKAC